MFWTGCFWPVALRVQRNSIEMIGISYWHCLLASLIGISLMVFRLLAFRLLTCNHRLSRNRFLTWLIGIMLSDGGRMSDDRRSSASLMFARLHQIRIESSLNLDLGSSIARFAWNPRSAKASINFMLQLINFLPWFDLAFLRPKTVSRWRVSSGYRCVFKKAG